MGILTVALALALGQSEASGPPPYADAVDVFIDVCTRGGGRFAPGTIVQIPYIGGDRRVVRSLPPMRHNRYYRLSLPSGEAKLAIQDTADEDDPENSRYCSVVVRGHDFDDAMGRIVVGRPLQGPPRTRGLIHLSHRTTSPDGYRLLIDRLGSGDLVMTSIAEGLSGREAPIFRELRRPDEKPPSPGGDASPPDAPSPDPDPRVGRPESREVPQGGLARRPAETPAR